MRIMKYVLSIGLTLVEFACSNPKQEKVDQLKSQAIEVHDEVMPRMDEIQAVNIELKKMRENIANDTSDQAEALRAEMSEHIRSLGDADEAMMSWMNQYDPNYEKEHPLDSAVSYYEQQTKSIADVKEQMEASITEGKALLKKLK